MRPYRSNGIPWHLSPRIYTYLHGTSLTQRRKVSQSVCGVLRCLRAIIFTQNWKSLSELVRGKQSTEDTEKSPRICAYLLVFFLSHEWARIFTNAVRSGIVSRRRRRLSQNNMRSKVSVYFWSPYRYSTERKREFLCLRDKFWKWYRCCPRKLVCFISSHEWTRIFTNIHLVLNTPQGISEN